MTAAIPYPYPARGSRQLHLRGAARTMPPAGPASRADPQGRAADRGRLVSAIAERQREAEIGYCHRPRDVGPGLCQRSGADPRRYRLCADPGAADSSPTRAPTIPPPRGCWKRAALPMSTPASSRCRPAAALHPCDRFGLDRAHWRAAAGALRAKAHQREAKRRRCLTAPLADPIAISINVKRPLSQTGQGSRA